MLPSRFLRLSGCLPDRLLRLPTARLASSTATGDPSDKEKKRQDIYAFNKQSLVLYGPIVNNRRSEKRKRKYTPVYYKPVKESDVDFIMDTEVVTTTRVTLPSLKLQVNNDEFALNLNELLAHPLVPGEGVDRSLWRLESDSAVSLRVHKLPSVTHILDKTQSTDSRRALERWRQEQIEIYGFAEFERQFRGEVLIQNQSHCYRMWINRGKFL